MVRASLALRRTGRLALRRRGRASHAHRTFGHEPAPGSPVRASARADPAPAEVGEFLNVGINPLLQAATPLLVLAGKLRTTLSHNDISGLRRQTLEEIRRFEERARSAGVSPETVLAARYALCTALDEAVLTTPWGSQSEWSAQTLLVQLHREAWGGEKFFEMLERISADPARHIDRKSVV